MSDVAPLKARSSLKLVAENKLFIRRNARIADNSPDKPYAFGEWKSNGAIAILKGSFCFEPENIPRGSVTDKTKAVYRNIRYEHELLKTKEKGVIIKNPDTASPYPYVFAKDYYYSTPTAAAQIILGKPASGKNVWIQEISNKPLSEISKSLDGTNGNTAPSDEITKDAKPKDSLFNDDNNDNLVSNDKAASASNIADKDLSFDKDTFLEIEKPQNILADKDDSPSETLSTVNPTTNA